MKAIEIKNLVKSYGNVKAVKGISFDVEKGSLFAFLGENGAGKSTTINVICSLLKKDSGSVKIFGYDLDKDSSIIRGMIGVIFQGSVLDPSLSVNLNLKTRASFYNIFGDDFKKRLNELTELLNLQDILNRPYGKLSGGQRRRVDIARGLINSPKLLILDEPTTGLDPQTRKAVWDVIDSLRIKEGMTVFLTTHYMEEANNAENVIILDEGEIVVSGTPIELKNKYSSDIIKLYSNESKDIENRLLSYSYSYDNGCYVIKIKDSIQAKEFIAKNGDILNNFEIIKGNMDDVFLNVTGKKIQGGGI